MLDFVIVHLEYLAAVFPFLIVGTAAVPLIETKRYKAVVFFAGIAVNAVWLSYLLHDTGVPSLTALLLCVLNFLVALVLALVLGRVIRGISMLGDHLVNKDEEGPDDDAVRPSPFL